MTAPDPKHTNVDILEAVDLEHCCREHPSTEAPTAGRYAVLIGGEQDPGERVLVDDPKPTGLQLLEVARRFPTGEHVLLLLQADGMLEEINLSETVDLRRPGVERFLAFRADRAYYFELDGRRFPWGDSTIGEPMLRRLARVTPDYGVWQEQRGQEDKRLTGGERVSLADAGLERFYTGIDQTQAGDGNVILPTADRRYLSENGIKHECLVEGQRKGLILREYPLPAGYDSAAADVLIILPAAYPDSPPDMFHTIPWIKSLGQSRYPKNADNAVQFGNRSWQRWSRHNNNWRPGIDNLRTMLRRVDAALAEAV